MAKAELVILLAVLSAAHKQVKKGDIYFHYKDPKKLYKVLELALNTQDEEQATVVVIYQSLEEDQAVWSRPLNDWLSEVEKNNKNIKKFTKKETRKVAGGVVLNAKRQILVVNQNGNSWSLPKGGIELHEDTLTAARREIYEESGVSELTLIKKLGTYHRYAIHKNIELGEDTNALRELTFFLFTTTQKKLAPQDPENPEARWVNQEDVEKLLTHPKDKEFFKSLSLELFSI